MKFFVAVSILGVEASVANITSIQRGNLTAKLRCDQGVATCGSMKESIVKVFEFINNALLFTKVIEVEVSMLDNIDGKPWSRLKGLTKTSYAQQEYQGVQYLYPQALHKQLFTRQYSLPDFRIFINPHRKYYFPKDFHKKQTSEEYSTIDLLAHEMLHGLGIITSFGNHALNGFSSRLCTVKNKQTTKVFCVSFFDKFIRNKDNIEIPKLIAKMNREALSIEADKIRLSKYHMYFTNQIEASATEKDGLFFKTNSGKRVYLETNNVPFKVGSSVSHIDLRYKHSKETLMTRATEPGQGTHDFAADCTWKTSPIGPTTLEILTTLGYRRNPAASFKNSLGGFLAKKRYK